MPAARTRRLRTVWTLSGLLAAYLLVQWLVLPPIHWGDTLRVFRYAAAWPDVPLDHHALRLGLVLPTRAAQALFGYGQVAFYVVAFAGGAALITGVYAVGRALFGDIVGVAGALVMLFSPYVVDTERFLTSGLILPDVPSAGVFALGVGALVAGVRREDGRHRHLLLGTAGVLFAYAYLIREFVPAMFIVIPFAFAFWRVPWRWMTWILGPMLLIWLGESALNALIHGDPLIRLNVSSEHGSALSDPRTPLETVGLWHRAFTDSARGQLLLVMLGLNLVGVAVLRDRRLALTLVWFGSLFAVLLALGGLVDSESPSLRIVLTRYWFPVFPALIVGGTGTLFLVFRWLREREKTVASWLVVLAVLGWLVPTVVVPGLEQLATSDRDTAWVELREWLGEHGQQYEEIWTDSRSDLMLDVYRHETLGGEQIWDGRIREFPYDLASVPDDEVQGDPVLFAPQGPAPPGAHAEILFRSSNNELVVAVVSE